MSRILRRDPTFGLKEVTKHLELRRTQNYRLLELRHYRFLWECGTLFLNVDVNYAFHISYAFFRFIYFKEGYPSTQAGFRQLFSLIL